MNIKTYLVGLIILVSVSCAGAQSGHAATLSTDSSSVFASDTINPIVGNFTGIPTPYSVGPGASFGGYNPLSGYNLQGVTFSTPNADGNVNINTAGFYGPTDLQVPYSVNSTYTGSLPDVLTITLPHPEKAFALDFDTLFASAIATFTLSNGYTTSVTTPSAMGQTAFIGFVSDTPFQTISLSVPNGSSWVVADFTQADVVPLPSSASMMALALLGLGGLLAYRQKKEHAKNYL